MMVSAKLITLWAFIFVSIALLFLYLVFPILMPFLIALIIAYIGDPLIERLSKWGTPRTLAVVLFFLLTTLFILTIAFSVVPLLQKQIVELIGLVPKVITVVQDKIVPFMNRQFNVDAQLDFVNLRGPLLKSLQQHSNLIGHVVAKIGQSSFILFAWMANLVLIPVVAFYLLRDWKIFLHRIWVLIPRAWEPTVVKLCRESDEVLSAFFRGQFLVMLALSCIYSLGLCIVGLNLSLFIGMIAGLASIVPYLGFIVGLSSAIIAAIFQFQALMPIFGVVIVFMIGQVLESAVLTPNLVGDRIGLHPVSVIFAVLAGGQLFGFVGVLLALPIAAIVMVVLRYLKRQYIQSELYTQSEL